MISYTTADIYIDLSMILFVLDLYFFYRHSKEMIEKLENSGLGFYVRDTDTHQKLGNHKLLVGMHALEGL